MLYAQCAVGSQYGLKKKDELGAPDSDAKTRKKRSNVGLESEGEDDGQCERTDALESLCLEMS